jgi:hypothetical protein
MGKHRHNRRRNVGQRMGQRSEPDQSGGAEQRLLRDVGGGNAGDPARDDALFGGGSGDSLPVDSGNVHWLSERVRIPRRPAPTIRRSFAALELNAVLNDPDVYPFITGIVDGPIDAAPLVENVDNYLLAAEGGALLFCQQEPGVYLLYNNWLKTHQGDAALLETLAAYRWMFANTDCVVIQSKIPGCNPQAIELAKLSGMLLDFERRGFWQTRTGLFDMSFFVLRYDEWARQQGAALADVGAKFYEHLAQEFVRHGRILERAGDNELFNARVGACMEMIEGEQPDKGVVLYNIWARLAEAAQIILVSKSPFIIDIGSAVLQREGESFKVLIVR